MSISVGRGGHVIIPTLLALCAKCIWIYWADSPRMIYNCPLDAVEIWDEHNCVWSKSYEEARGLFVALGNRLKAVGHPDLIQIESIMFDVERGASSRQSTIIAGANTIDALLLTMKVGGDNQANVVNVIHSAGTHGVEGFAGSAIQLNFLREMILQSAEQSSGEKSYVRKILLIHAVNPVGMRYHRRFNENNVDLNRNVLSREQWEEVRSSDPNMFGYVTLDRVLNPFYADGFSWVEAVGDGFAGDLTFLRQQDDKAYKASSAQKPTTAWLDDLRDIAYTFVSCLTTISITGYRQAKKTM
mmetsp:Transcript_24906/g.59126  ORF Transcript_24906/g.59126 Transcript_24906/m.59126 type:complete len:300 (-) Transcript_24906:2838-3737(-)